MCANAFAPGNGEDARWLYGLSLRTRNETGWNFSGVASLFDVTKDISRTASTAGNGPGTVTYGDGTGWRTLDLKADYRPQQLKGGHWVTLGYHYDNYRLSNTTYNTSDWQAATISAFNNAFAGKTETQALYAAIQKVKHDTAAAINVENFAGAMRALAELRAPVDAFFDKVTVNVADGPDAAQLRANRLALLSEIRAATLTVADFSKIAG